MSQGIDSAVRMRTISRFVPGLWLRAHRTVIGYTLIFFNCQVFTNEAENDISRKKGQIKEKQRKVIITGRELQIVAVAV